MATMEKMIRMIYLKNALDKSADTKKAQKINNQLRLYKAQSEPLLKQAGELVELSDKSDNISDLNQILQSFDSLNIGVGQHDNQVRIEAAKVKTKVAALNSSIAIKNETDRLMQVTSTEGMNKVVGDLDKQKNIISGSLNSETLKGLNSDLDALKERSEGLTRMIPYDTNLSTSNIDLPQIGYGYEGAPEEVYNPMTPGGRIDQRKKVQMESARLLEQMPDQKDYLQSIIQPEYDIARSVNTQGGWEGFNKLMQDMPAKLRAERSTRLKSEQTEKNKNDKSKLINKLNRSIGGYTSTMNEISKGINPIGLGNFDTSQVEGLPNQIKIILKTLPDIGVYGNKNSDNALQSYDPKGLLSQIDESILQMLSPELSHIEQANPKLSWKLEDLANNPDFINQDPTSETEDKIGHKDIMDSIIAKSMNMKTGEFKLHPEFEETALSFKNMTNSGQVPEKTPLTIKSQLAVSKIVRLREQLLSDIKSGIFDPYEDSEIGAIPDSNNKKSNMFSNRKNR